MSTTQTEIIKNLISSLEWYIQEDDTSRGGHWEEDNSYWIRGQERAILAVKEARDFFEQPSVDPDIEGLAHELWAVSQLAPGEGITDGVDRILELLAWVPMYILPKPVPVSVRVPDRSERSMEGSEAWYWDPISGCWFLLPGIPLNNHYTHWLPYRALPNPEEITETSEINPSFATGEATPLEQWHEGDGDVLWWKFPIDEPPYVGSPLDTDWPGYHTHFTRIPVPSQPPKP